MTDWGQKLAELQKPPPATLEEILSGADYFNLKTISPLQRAICRLLSGEPLGDLELHPHVINALGDRIRGWKACKVKENYIISGIRGGKSLIVAALAWYWTQTVDLSLLGPGEIARISILSVHKTVAKPTFDHICGRGAASKKLAPLIAESTADSIIIKQASSGKLVEICIVAGERAGSSLVARWSAGCIVDEAPRVSSESDGVINFEDSRHAVLERLVPGAQFVAVGSPWAPHGYIYDIVTKRHGSPGTDVLVMRAPSYHLNPIWWTPERCAQSRLYNPDLYHTEIEAQFASVENNMFPLPAIDACTRRYPLIVPPEPGLTYVAAMDPGLRGNSWTLVIATRRGNKRIVAFAQQWTGTKENPLHTGNTMRSVGDAVEKYGVKLVYTDQYMNDVMYERARECGFTALHMKLNQENRTKMHQAVQARFLEGNIEIPDDPILRTDLIRTQKVPLPNGGVGIRLPHTSDKRHADYVPSLMLSLNQFCMDENIKEAEKPPAKILEERIKEERLETVKSQIRNDKRFRLPGR